MSRLENILKDYDDLKKEMERIVETVKENEAKSTGFKVVEYAFLLSESLADISSKPLKYLEEIFEIDRVVLYVNGEVFDFDRETDDTFSNIVFHEEKTFKYFFVEKKPYYGNEESVLTSEYKIFEDIGSYLICPIVESGKIVGSLNLYSFNPFRFSEDGNTDFLKSLSTIVGVSLRKLYSTEIIYRQTRTDFLTGCYNKLAMTELLNKFINRYERHEHGFYFVLIDVDNFKKVNDKHGHLIGDELLVDISDTIVSRLRTGDIFGRFGGDEFFLMIVKDDKTDIDSVIEKLRISTHEVFKKHGCADYVSLSGGVAAVPNDYSKGLRSEDIVKLADDRLYKSKSQGKNKFIGCCNDN